MVVELFALTCTPPTGAADDPDRSRFRRHQITEATINTISTSAPRMPPTNAGTSGESLGDALVLTLTSMSLVLVRVMLVCDGLSLGSSDGDDDDGSDDVVVTNVLLNVFSPVETDSNVVELNGFELVGRNVVVTFVVLSSRVCIGPPPSLGGGVFGETTMHTDEDG